MRRAAAAAAASASARTTSQVGGLVGPWRRGCQRGLPFRTVPGWSGLAVLISVANLQTTTLPLGRRDAALVGCNMTPPCYSSPSGAEKAWEAIISAPEVARTYSQQVGVHQRALIVWGCCSCSKRCSASRDSCLVLVLVPAAASSTLAQHTASMRCSHCASSLRAAGGD